MQYYLVCQKIELVSDFFSTSDSLQLLLLLLFSWILVIILKHTLTHILIIHHELFTEEDKKLFRFRIRSNAIKIKWGKLCSAAKKKNLFFLNIWGIFGLKNRIQVEQGFSSFKCCSFLEAIWGCCGTQMCTQNNFGCTQNIIFGYPKWPL